ncbi:BspA family leucine-rich repeat surface protein [Flagellimonas iocasae]|uniref:BspA family leucine-rich repeat surface protein n=1 Tax=Flagellimonas iocasae TaxID=2055905 RepID=A0ABW4Y191_9FLAO
MLKKYVGLLICLVGFVAQAQSEFITTWKTDNSGTSNDNQITIPTFPGETYDYTVDWGDGTSDSNVIGDITHTYPSSGTYQISITGTFPRIFFNESGDKDKLLNIKQWGNIQWTSMESAFAGCFNLAVAATDTPNLSNVTSLRRMFFYCYYSFDATFSREFANFNGIENFNSWDVSTITDMSAMFDKSSFNQDISSWDVSLVEDMSYMFYSSTFNSDISTWNVGNVTNMSGLFGSSSFNQDISGWDVGNVQFFDLIFNSTYFNHDITNWNVENAISMRHAFSQGDFDQDLSSWNISNVTDLSNAFDESDLSKENYDAILTAWAQLPNLQFGVVLGANDAVYCLAEAERNSLMTNFGWTINDYGSNCEDERAFITTWKTDNPGPSNDNQITIPTNPLDIYNYRVDWGDGTFDEGVTGDITHTYATPGEYVVSITGKFPRIYFNGSELSHEFPSKNPDDLKIISVNQWGTNRWKSMSYAFSGCENLDVKATDIPDFSRGVFLDAMFLGCSSLVGNESISDWVFEDGYSTINMFRDATNFNIPIDDWDVSSIRYMRNMFENASSFNQDLSQWNVENVEAMNNLFIGSGLSNKNYNNILIAWSQLPSLQNGVRLDAPNNYYCSAKEERQSIIDTYGWTINDAGENNECHFITTWKTDNPGTSGDNQITIPTYSVETYDYTVDWGDGTSDTNVTGDITHTYAAAGTYQVAISGEFPAILFQGNQDSNLKITQVNQWGDIRWRNFSSAFSGCRELDVVATDIPNLENVNSTQGMFLNCSSLLGNESFGLWDVSTIIDGSSMFLGCSLFNQNIGGWDVSNMVYMDYFFFQAESFNQPIGNWDISNAERIFYMFSFANSFNQDISEWRFPKVTNLAGMFQSATSFNQDISSWDVSTIENFGAMFNNAPSFDQPIGIWDMSNAVELSLMFAAANSFTSDITNWDVSNVTTMEGLFKYNTTFNQDLSSWDTSNVTSMAGMFEGAVAFNQDLSQWNIGNVGAMNNLFIGSGFSNKNYNSILIGWSQLPSLQNGVQLDAPNNYYCNGKEERQSIIDTYGWTINDAGENNECQFITTWKTDNPGKSGDNQISIPVGSGPFTVDWGDGSVETDQYGEVTHTYTSPGSYVVSLSGSLSSIYFNSYVGNESNSDATKLLEINQWGSTQWSSMRLAFSGCSNLEVEATDIPDFSALNSLVGMFRYCQKMTGNSSFNNWDLSSVTNVGAMFLEATSFNSYIGDWNTSNITSMNTVFQDASSFNQDIGGWDTSKVETMRAMFHGATSFNQDIGNWSVGNVTDMTQMLFETYNFNQDISGWDVSKVTKMDAMFGGSGFNQDIGDWDVSQVTNMNVMFYGTSFNQDIGNWNVSNVTDMGGMFGENTVFNQDIGDWDVSNVTFMGSMFSGAIGFDQNLGTWDVSSVTNMPGMFDETSLSTENYDKTLQGWASLNLQNDVYFDGGLNLFCDASDARQFIIDTFNWTIEDLGKIPYCNEDNDEDGVLDHLDACLDTQPGAVVNANGCEVIPNTAIKVYASTPSCIGNEDGSIEIIMETEGHLLDIALESDSYSNQFMDVPSGTPFKVDDLPEGSYSVSVSIPEIVFEQRYVATINSLESLTGKRALLDSKAAMVTYSVSGSTNYQVLVNDEKKNFSFADSGQQTIMLDHIPTGPVTISIFGESDCQGMISDSFYFGDSVEVFPTITSSTINIFSNSTTYKAQIFDFTGRLVNEKQLDGQENTVDLSTIKSGPYILKLYMEREQRTLKIIKK